jgi:hypothetical protein
MKSFPCEVEIESRALVTSASVTRRDALKRTREFNQKAAKMIESL